HRVAGEIAADARFLNAFFDGGDELARDRAAEDVVDEFEVRSAGERFDLDLAVAELAVAAGLFLVPPVRLGGGLDRLAVRNARRLAIHAVPRTPMRLRVGVLD